MKRGWDVSLLCRALADPVRRAALDRLAQKPHCVRELAREFPQSRAAISQHLKVLLDAGLVSVQPQGGRRLYCADPKGLAWLQSYIANMSERAGAGSAPPAWAARMSDAA